MRRYHFVSRQLTGFRVVLRTWIRLNRIYGETLQWQDCAWWANERASTGIFAAAVWKCGGVALEEYSTKKTKKKEHRTGRCDLFFAFEKNHFACEIKQIFPRLKSGRTNNISEVAERFNLACDDARNLFPKEGRRLGVCFVTPRFSSSQIEHMDDCLKDYLNGLLQNRKKLDFDAIAWFFPEEARGMKWPANQKTYPGVIVLIREIFRS